MRIATLERFADPSRQCELSKFVTANDDVVAWDLAALSSRRWRLLRLAPRMIATWLKDPLPLQERSRLLRACLATGGARLGALAYAPDLWRQVHAGAIDRLAVFSRKDFALAALLADGMDRPPYESVSHGTKYFGEFAFELLAVVPYAYWLHRQGQLKFTISTSDTRCLYFFSPNHEERSVARRYVPITEYPVGQAGMRRYDRLAFPDTLDTRQWLPPPYKELYRSDRFRFEREPCVVLNKTSDERYLGRGLAVNSMDVGLLLQLIGKLRDRYQVIYIRPRASDIVNDHQTIHEIGDIDAVKRHYPDVLTIQELRPDNADLSFNELQLSLLAACDSFVSVLGGASYLASYFAGTNVIYAREGWEVSCGAFENWFHAFSGARVIAARTARDLLASVERDLL